MLFDLASDEYFSTRNTHTTLLKLSSSAMENRHFISMKTPLDKLSGRDRGSETSLYLLNFTSFYKSVNTTKCTPPLCMCVRIFINKFPKEIS
jgi:hypothetical protein